MLLAIAIFICVLVAGRQTKKILELRFLLLVSFFSKIFTSRRQQSTASASLTYCNSASGTGNWLTGSWHLALASCNCHLGIRQTFGLVINILPSECSHSFIKYAHFALSRIHTERPAYMDLALGAYWLWPLITL